MDLTLLENYTAQKGALPPRSYYIPFSSFTDEIRKERSDRVTVLDKWKFAYYPFYTQSVEADEPTQTIAVPSCWQKLGYDYPLKGVQPPTKERVENAKKILRAGNREGI